MDGETKKALLGTMRLPFLILTPACVFLGYACAVWTGADINYLHLLIAFIGATAAHVSVNALNEYYDFRSGLDLSTQRTPFSGGSGALPSCPGKAHIALTTGMVSFVITGLVGVYFIYVWGWAILPLGLAGLLIIAAYTTFITKTPLLCLVAPGIGFGTLMVVGTSFALTGIYSLTSFAASMVPFFLVSDLLLLNQFPDAEADRKAGRRHLLIAAGEDVSARVYAVFMVSTYVTVFYGWLIGLFPPSALMALVSIALAAPTIRGVLKYSDRLPKLVPYLGRNVAIVVLTPALLAAGLLFGRWLGR